MTRGRATSLERDISSLVAAVERIEKVMGQRVLALENEVVVLRAELARMRHDSPPAVGGGLVPPDGLT